MRRTTTAALRFGAVFTVALGVGAGFAPASAETALERRIRNEASPHQRLAGHSRAIPTHWVHAIHQDGDDDHARQSLAKLKESQASCVRTNKADHLPVEEVREWPSVDGFSRVDHYVTFDADVVYFHSATYGVRPDNCGLMEHEHLAADVYSALGICEVDFDRKVSSGQCGDPQAGTHLSAKGNVWRDARDIRLAPASLVPHATGSRRIVLGQTCAVATNPLDPDPAGTQCFALGGKFPGWGPQVVPQATTLIIETQSQIANNIKPAHIGLDMSLPADLFTPQFQPGIRFEGAP